MFIQQNTTFCDLKLHLFNAFFYQTVSLDSTLVPFSRILESSGAVFTVKVYINNSKSLTKKLILISQVPKLGVY